MKSCAIQLCLVAGLVGACSSIAESPDESNWNSPADVAHATPFDAQSSGESRYLPYIDAASTPSPDDFGRNDSEAAWADSGVSALDASSVDADLPPGDPNWIRHCIAFAGDDSGVPIPQGANCIAERLLEGDDVVTADVSGALLRQSSACPPDTDGFGSFNFGGGQSRDDKCCANSLSGQADVQVHLTLVVRLAHFSASAAPPPGYAFRSPIDKTGYWANRGDYESWPWERDLDPRTVLTAANGSRWTFTGNAYSYMNWLIEAAGEQRPTAAWNYNDVSQDARPRVHILPYWLFKGDPWRKLSPAEAVFFELKFDGFQYPSRTYNCQPTFFRGGLQVDYSSAPNTELQLYR